MGYRTAELYQCKNGLLDKRHQCYGTHFQMILENIQILISLKILFYVVPLTLTARRFISSTTATQCMPRYIILFFSRPVTCDF